MPDQSEYDEPKPRYTTRQDAIEQNIMPALTDGKYDYDAIFDEVFTWKIDVNGDGAELLNTAGFEQVVTTEQFWEIAEKHEITE